MFSASVTAIGDGTKQYKSASAYASLYDQFGGGSSFTLSPHTLVSIVGSYELAVSRNPWETGDIWASVSLQLRGGPPSSGQQSGEVSNSIYFYPWAASGPLQDARAENFGLSFLNARSESLTGTFNVVVGASAGVVPEPGAPLIALSGAAIAMAMAIVRQRRTTHKSA
jgi:hypothetical protein